MDIVLFITGLFVFCLALLCVSLSFASSRKKVPLENSNEKLSKTSSKMKKVSVREKTRILSQKEIEAEMVEATIATIAAIQYHLSKQETTQLVNQHSTSIWRKKSRESISPRSCKCLQKQTA